MCDISSAQSVRDSDIFCRGHWQQHLARGFESHELLKRPKSGRYDEMAKCVSEGNTVTKWKCWAELQSKQNTVVSSVSSHATNGTIICDKRKFYQRWSILVSKQSEGLAFLHKRTPKRIEISTIAIWAKQKKTHIREG